MFNVRRVPTVKLLPISKIMTNWNTGCIDKVNTMEAKYTQILYREFCLLRTQ